MKILADKEIQEVLSGVFTDLGAGWFALVFIGQTFVSIDSLSELLIFLTYNIGAGTVSVLLAVMLAKRGKVA